MTLANYTPSYPDGFPVGMLVRISIEPIISGELPIHNTLLRITKPPEMIESWYCDEHENKVHMLEYQQEVEVVAGEYKGTLLAGPISWMRPATADEIEELAKYGELES